MSEMKSYTPGTFSWVDLSSSDTAGAKKFYSSLFGWTANDAPMPEGMGTYSMMQMRGRDAAAISSMPPGQENMPPHWNCYVTVANAEQAATRAAKLGGTVVAAAFDVMDVGRMAVIQDPSGAYLSLWEPKKHIGAGVVNEPGALCWNELYTTNPDVAGKFYIDMFGWETKVSDMGGTPYTMFSNGGRPAGGMLQMPAEMAGVPSNWATYFAVADCDASFAKAQQLGGRVLVPPMDIPGTGRFAMLADPQGAAFAIIKLDAPAA